MLGSGGKNIIISLISFLDQNNYHQYINNNIWRRNRSTLSTFHCIFKIVFRIKIKIAINVWFVRHSNWNYWKEFTTLLHFACKINSIDWKRVDLFIFLFKFFLPMGLQANQKEWKWTTSVRNYFIQP